MVRYIFSLWARKRQLRRFFARQKAAGSESQALRSAAVMPRDEKNDCHEDGEEHSQENPGARVAEVEARRRRTGTNAGSESRACSPKESLPLLHTLDPDRPLGRRDRETIRQTPHAITGRRRMLVRKDVFKSDPAPAFPSCGLRWIRKFRRIGCLQFLMSRCSEE